jgi:hypothetical protein
MTGNAHYNPNYPTILNVLREKNVFLHSIYHRLFSNLAHLHPHGQPSPPTNALALQRCSRLSLRRGKRRRVGHGNEQHRDLVVLRHRCDSEYLSLLYCTAQRREPLLQPTRPCDLACMKHAQEVIPQNRSQCDGNNEHRNALIILYALLISNSNK